MNDAQALAVMVALFALAFVAIGFIAGMMFGIWHERHRRPQPRVTESLRTRRAPGTPWDEPRP